MKRKIIVNKNIAHKKCNHSCENVHQCPICKFNGMAVPSKTVIHLSQNNYLEKNDEYYICTNPKCNCVYFSKNVILEKRDISTKIWYKSPLEDFIVCYCHDIKLIDIIEAVSALKGSCDKDEILKYLNKNIEKKHCDILNPIGQNCDKLFNNAIEFAKQVYEKGEN